MSMVATLQKIELLSVTMMPEPVLLALVLFVAMLLALAALKWALGKKCH